MYNSCDTQYQALLQRLLDEGAHKTDRTNTGTVSLFGPQMRFNLAEGFPLLTTKRVHLKSIVHELLWFIAGDTNIKYLVDNGVNIWNEWPYEAYRKHAQSLEEVDYDLHVDDPGQNCTRVMTQAEFTARIKSDAVFAERWGDLGPVYGAQWRAWGKVKSKSMIDQLQHPGIDQLSQALDQLHNAPDSRRMVVSAWNVADLPKMKLPACHCLFQFYTVPLTVEERCALWQKIPRHLRSTPSSHKFGGTPEEEHQDYDDRGIPRYRLSCQLYQRSADVFLGVPFNIASYALLTLMVAQVTNMVPGEFIWTGGDTHLYANHFEQAREQLTRAPRPLPTLTLNPEVLSLFDFKYEDVGLSGYDPHPAIKAPVAV